MFLLFCYYAVTNNKNAPSFKKTSYKSAKIQQIMHPNPTFINKLIVNLLTMVENTPLPHKIQLLAHVIEQATASSLQEESGLAFNSYIILYVLNKKGEINQSKLADQLKITTAAISKRVKILMEREFVTTTINKENRREHLLNITEKGKQILKTSTTLLDKQFNELIKEYKHKEEFELLLNELIKTVCSEHHDNETC